MPSKLNEPLEEVKPPAKVTPAAKVEASLASTWRSKPAVTI